MLIKCLRPNRKKYGGAVQNIDDVRGLKVAEVEHIAEILINSIAKELQESESQKISEIVKGLKTASTMFTQGIVEGQTPETYIEQVHVTSGVPIPAVRKAFQELGRALFSIDELIHHTMPALSRYYEQYERMEKKTVYWLRKGNVLSVVAPGNHPLVHLSWLQALAAGYKILLKPSQKDIFTPYRLVRCLLECGVSQDMIAFLPGSQAVTREVIRCGDIALIFGKANFIESISRSSSLLLRGPGYSKVFWDNTMTIDIEEQGQIAIDSIAQDGGVKCVNCSGVVIHKKFKQAKEYLSEKFRQWPQDGLFAPDGQNPVFPLIEAKRICTYLFELISARKIKPVDRHPIDILIDHGDGSSTLMPFLFEITEKLDIELPFPCSWIYHCTNEQDFSICRNSLSLSMLTSNRELIHQSIVDPSIKKVLLNNKPTWWNEDAVPHDGFITNHLFFAKGVLQ